MQVDRIWEREGLLYNPFMAQLLSRKEYYVLRCNIRPDVVGLVEECNGQWAGAWRLGGAACGDESVVPHKGIRAGPLRMFIARKPHSTGAMLYWLADATSGYVVDMYLPVHGQTRAPAVRQQCKQLQCPADHDHVGNCPPFRDHPLCGFLFWIARTSA